MGWLASNLLPITICGLFAVVAGFFLKDRRTGRFLLGGGLVALAGVGLVAVYVAFSSPGREDTVDERDRPDPRPEPVGELEPLRFAWDSEAFADWPVAELLAAMSEESYQAPVDAEVSFQQMGFQQTKTFVDSSMIGYVASVDDVTVIVFRGTDNDVDWIVNLNPSTVETPNGPIHKGFYNAYQPLKPQIVKLLKNRNSKHLWITGHSLGGALAVVCAYDLVENEGLKVDGLITFGQPMVARRQLAEHLDALLIGKYAHYVNGSDLVPRIPPSHSHFGSLVWFTADGVKRSKPKQLTFSAESSNAPSDIAEVTPLTDREFRRLKDNLSEERTRPKFRAKNGDPTIGGTSSLIADHAMALYLEKIRSVSAGTGRNE